MQHAADRTVLVTSEHHQRVLVVLAAQRIHRHREAAFGRALASALQHLLDLGHDVLSALSARGVQAQEEFFRLRSRPWEPIDGVARPADRPSSAVLS
jgi:hypothetical protein